MPQTLLTIFPDPNELVALEPEDLGDVILEIVPGVTQNGRFSVEGLMAQLFDNVGTNYPHGVRNQVAVALVEAISRLISFGLVVQAYDQPSSWFQTTRRARTLRTRQDVERFRRGRILPIDLLHPTLAEKVWPQFFRGDYDVAVFQAFKEVEIATRNAANLKGAGYPDSLVGVPLMQKAFQTDSGPLANTTLCWQSAKRKRSCSQAR